MSTPGQLTVSLRSGGTVTVTASVDVFRMSREDRAFVFDLIDEITKYEGGPGPPIEAPLIANGMDCAPAPIAKHKCSRCGAAGHRAPGCPENDGAARRSAFGTVVADGTSGFSARWYDRETHQRKRGFATRGEAEAFLARIRPADPRDPSSAAARQYPQEPPGPSGGPGAPAAADDLPMDLAAMGDEPEVPTGPAELNRAVADPGFVPEPKSTREILAAPEPGDDLRRDDAVHVAPGPAVAAPAPATRFSIRGELDENDRGGAARRRTNDRRRIEAASAAASPPAPDAGEEEVADEEDGAGWSPPDADGRQTCLPCAGEGIDNRPGEGAGRCCLHCDGEGYRWPGGETAPAAPPPAATPAAESPPVPPAPASRPPAMPPPAVIVSRPAFFHPGRGWGPVDAAGVSVHVLCNGTGKIRVKGVARGCYPCQGSGKRQCVPTSAAAEGRTP